ncbi:sodium-coupled monocarboxylate transporter 1 isoform X1 [Zeugodacus cucurbitae]|uniref:sodium-coupled monocarboxylate transporter 1 isoform X1 n=1 Tax=Zeugodacus cucurbitae TaxID=28588 RepID=UPI0023D924FD|nr:sodium-coupled monocarboxylate transporter 1 isoform X1 [Zeugodacus cucurbitae]
MSVENNTLGAVVHQFHGFSFGTVDYAVFVFMLSISLLIGVYFGFFGHVADNTEEYLLGGKRMKTIPIAISLVASQLSAISMMAIPAELYSFGINWVFSLASLLIIIPTLCWIIIPVFYNNNLSNCYEYLELRFNRSTRNLITFAFMFTSFLWLPVIIFIPSLAFAQVTGSNIHLINTYICSICVIYTMLGGIKAVVWTDVFQGAIMIGSVAVVCFLGTKKVGGFNEVINIAARGGRLDVNFTFDARTRITFWNTTISGFVLWTAYVGLNQSCVQRVVALPTLGHVRRSLLLFGIGVFVIMILNCFVGITMYALYHDCDPLTRGYVQKADKMMPFFVQDIAGHLKGMPGIFISSVFSAALSTTSASLNALAGVVYMDYIKPRIKHTERRANLIMRGFICICGVYSIISGFIVEKFSSILQVTYSIGGVTLGSVFGVYMLGMLVPRAHGKAAFWSVVASMVSMIVIVVGAQGRLKYSALPSSVENCPANNTNETFFFNATSTTSINLQTPSAKDSFNIFDLSFNWYVTVGNLIVFFVALPLSYILPAEKNFKLDLKLLSPVIHPFYKYKLANTEELPELKKVII